MYFVNSNHFICVYKIHLAYYSKLNIYLQVSYEVQSAAARLPFWTLTHFPATSTSNPPRLGFLFGLQHAFPPLQRPIRRASASLLDFNTLSRHFNVQSAALRIPFLDFNTPSHRSNVQSTTAWLPFWTSTRLPAALTSNPPRLGFPFGLQHTFPPL